MGQFIPLIGVALSAAGTGVGMAAAAQARSDANKAISTQVQKQREFQARALPVFQQSLEQSSPGTAGRQIQAGEQGANDLYQKLSMLPANASYNPIQLDSPAEGRLDAVLGQQRTAQAANRGLQDYALQQWLKNLDVSSQLGTINNLSGASAQTAPYLAQLAAQNSAGMGAMGSLLSTAGGLAGMYAAVNPYKPTLGGSPRTGFDAMPSQLGQA